ncbi:MAG TPA: hypothetical protein VF546_11010 [Pyrinomonadaceae bacterium]
MLLLIPGSIIALAAGSYLLALVSDEFAYGLSRVVEAAFDFVEYRAALRARRQRTLRALDAPGGRAVVYSHAA